MVLVRLIADTVFAVVALAVVGWLGVRAVRFAKKGASGAQVLGAAFLLFGFGNFRDPTNEIVQQAKQLKQREDDDSGDPPSHEDDDACDEGAQPLEAADAAKCHRLRKEKRKGGATSQGS